MNEISRSYNGVKIIFSRYWSIYGGWKGLVFSPYFHVAILFTLFLKHYWENQPWWDIALSILPNTIGFALGGYAIWLGFGDEKFRNKIKDPHKNGGPSAYLQVSATFSHFIIVQLFALLGALIAKANYFELTNNYWLGKIFLKNDIPLNFISVYIAPWFWCLGFTLFIYSLMTAIAATLAVFRVATWLDHFQNNSDQN